MVGAQSELRYESPAGGGEPYYRYAVRSRKGSRAKQQPSLIGWTGRDLLGWKSEKVKLDYPIWSV
jgi:hypothetical protein